MAWVSGDLTTQPGLGGTGVAKSTGFAVLFGLSGPNSPSLLLMELGIIIAPSCGDGKRDDI